jgi:hypothetical protein
MKKAKAGSGPSPHVPGGTRRVWKVSLLILMVTLLPALFLTRDSGAQFWISVVGVTLIVTFSYLLSAPKRRPKLRGILGILAALTLVLGPSMLVRIKGGWEGIFLASWLFSGLVMVLLAGGSVMLLFPPSAPMPPNLNMLRRRAFGCAGLAASLTIGWFMVKPLASDTLDLQSRPPEAFLVLGKLTRSSMSGGRHPVQQFEVEGYRQTLESPYVRWDVTQGDTYQFVVLPASHTLLDLRHVDPASPEAWGRPWPRGGCGTVPSKAQRWALACHAVLDDLNRVPCFSLGGTDRYDFSMGRSDLNDWWEVQDHASAVKMLAWLKDEGHRKQYDRILELLHGSALQEAWIRFMGLMDPKTARRIELAKRLGPALGAQGILAWDLSRLIWLAGHCKAQGYLDDEEAWEWIMAAACRMQQSYGSWAQMQQAYLAGRRFWQPFEPHQPQVEAISALLLDPANASSPYNQLPWNLSLDCAPTSAPGGSI